MNLDIALAVIIIFSAACYLMMGSRLIALRNEVGAVPMGVLFCIISVWTIGAAIELLSTSFLVFSIGRTCHFIGTALLPVAAYVTFREYTGNATPTRQLVLLMIIPMISITLAATNQYHEFMWYLPAANETGEFLTRPERWGPWFLFVHAPHSYVVIGAAMISLLLHSNAVAPAHRRGLFLLVAACMAPLGSTLAYDFGVGPDTVSYVAIVFAAMLPMYGWLILGEQIFEFTPLAYETVFQNMRDPVVVIDDDYRVIGLNHGAEHMLSVVESDALRQSLDVLFGDDSPEVFEALDSGVPQKMLTSTGRFLHVQASPISGHGKSLRGGQVLMFRDVSDVERAQLEVRRSEKLMRTLINHSVNGILRLRWHEDENGDARTLRCIFANAAAGKFLDVEADDLVDVEADRMFEMATAGMDRRRAATVREDARKAVEAGRSVEIELQQVRGVTKRWLRMICQPVGDDFALTFVDITDSKAKERQMESIAWSDPLTGVLNRRGFERDATRKLSRSADDATGALLFIDLNGFKKINDTHGHEVGDQLLRTAAERLRRCLRSRDIIGRPGGDEFVVLVPNAPGEVADKLATRLVETLEKDYIIGPHTLGCAASIGLALYPEHANTLTGLLREADQAMYRAKARCRGVRNINHTDLLEKAV